MFRIFQVILLSFIGFIPMAVAQTQTDIDCSRDANRDNPVCVAANELPEGDVQNFLFLVGPVAVGAGLLAAIASGGGGSASAPSTLD